MGYWFSFQLWTPVPQTTSSGITDFSEYFQLTIETRNILSHSHQNPSNFALAQVALFLNKVNLALWSSTCFLGLMPDHGRIILALSKSHYRHCWIIIYNITLWFSFTSCLGTRRQKLGKVLYGKCISYAEESRDEPQSQLRVLFLMYIKHKWQQRVVQTRFPSRCDCAS